MSGKSLCTNFSISLYAQSISAKDTLFSLRETQHPEAKPVGSYSVSGDLLEFTEHPESSSRFSHQKSFSLCLHPHRHCSSKTAFETLVSLSWSQHLNSDFHVLPEKEEPLVGLILEQQTLRHPTHCFLASLQPRGHAAHTSLLELLHYNAGRPLQSPLQVFDLLFLSGL